MVNVGSETLTIRKDNSGNKVAGFLSGFGGAAFSWNGHPTGRVNLHGEGLNLAQRTVELESNIPAPIQTATAATLLVVNRIHGPSEQSPGARRFELFTD